MIFAEKTKTYIVRSNYANLSEDLDLNEKSIIY